MPLPPAQLSISRLSASPSFTRRAASRWARVLPREARGRFDSGVPAPSETGGIDGGEPAARCDDAPSDGRPVPANQQTRLRFRCSSGLSGLAVKSHPSPGLPPDPWRERSRPGPGHLMTQSPTGDSILYGRHYACFCLTKVRPRDGHMRRRSRAPKAEAEPAPRAHVGMAYEDGELKHMAARPPFSFLSAVKYLTILSILLWWLPTFGQMIAGFVGGRRAGSPWRGVVASLIPLLVIFSGLYLLDHGAFGDPAAGRAWPAAGAEQVTSAPGGGPYADFAFGYFASFLAWIPAAIAQNMSGYLVTVIFAYIGGVVAGPGAAGAGRP